MTAARDQGDRPPAPASATIDEQQLEAYFALTEVASLLHHAVERHLREDGDLTYVQFQILAVLGDSESGSVRMTDLADRIVYSRSGITYQVERLGGRGLIAREPSADDERSTVVSLTPSGRGLLERVMPGHVEVVERMLFRSLSGGDVTSLREILGRVRDRMRQEPPRSAAPRRARRTRRAGRRPRAASA